MGLKLITPPAAEPVSVADLKAHLRIDSAEEDTLLAAMIKAARDYCEKYQNRAYITQTWDLVLDSFPAGDRIRVPLPPLQSVVSIKYYDTDDAEQTMPSGEYMVDALGEPGRVILRYGKSWPSVTLRPANGLIVRFMAGYGATGSEVPERVVQAIKLLAGHMYENRESTDTRELKEVPFAVHALLGLDRIWPV